VDGADLILGNIQNIAWEEEIDKSTALTIGQGCREPLL